MVVDLAGKSGVASFRNPTMGRVTVDVELRNYSDTILAEQGQLAPESVRKCTVSGVVDTGASQLIIPGSVATQLGLTKIGDAFVRFADNRRESRAVVKDVEVRLFDRRATFHAVVEPNREDALIGAIVLEALDFIVDCGEQTLVPRDPHRIVVEIESATAEDEAQRWDRQLDEDQRTGRLDRLIERVRDDIVAARSKPR
jgi:predicted aspartyl protease